MRQGLGKDFYWRQRFPRYWHTAQVKGLRDPEGRKAMAKFVATAVGLLESAARVYPPLPRREYHGEGIRSVLEACEPATPGTLGGPSPAGAPA
jgi:hypothetical protein